MFFLGIPGKKRRISAQSCDHVATHIYFYMRHQCQYKYEIKHYLKFCLQKYGSHLKAIHHRLLNPLLTFYNSCLYGLKKRRTNVTAGLLYTRTLLMDYVMYIGREKSVYITRPAGMIMKSCFAAQLFTAVMNLPPRATPAAARV